MKCVRITIIMKMRLAAVATITMNTVTSAGMSTAMSRNTSTAMMKHAAAAKLILMKGMVMLNVAVDMSTTTNISMAKAVVPGHPEDCQCEICHPHEEYCDVCGESLENCTCRMPDAHCVKKVYILKNLGCAHCAAKMEHRIKELPGVEYANISYVTKQLRLSAVNHEAVLPAIKEICTSIESGVEVVPREGEGPFNFKTQVYVLENLGCANCRR